LIIIIFELPFCFAVSFLYFFCFYAPVVNAGVFVIFQSRRRRLEEFISLRIITQLIVPSWRIRRLKSLISQSFLTLQTLLVWNHLCHLTGPTFAFFVNLPNFTMTLLRASRWSFQLLIPTLFSAFLRILMSVYLGSSSYFLYSFLLRFNSLKILH